jgi:pilus assembly protein CpaE
MPLVGDSLRSTQEITRLESRKMKHDTLNTLVLHHSATQESALTEALRKLPQVQVTEAGSLKDFVRTKIGTAPDLIILDLGHEKSLPEELGDLTGGWPDSAVMVCSHNREPDFLIRVIQLGVREFVPLPLNPADLQAAVERVQAARKKRPAPLHEAKSTVIAVTGLRGGVGATSVAVNLSAILAERWPGRVALVDLGRPFPDVDKFLDLKPGASMLDLAEQGRYLDHGLVLKTLQVLPTKLSVLPGSFHLNLTEELWQKLLVILRSLFDWIVVDLGNWPDDFYLKALDEADEVLLITELLFPSLDNLRKLWSLYHEWGLNSQKIKLVVNRYYKENGLGLADLERIPQRPIFGTLPSDYAVLSECINQGVPLNQMAPRSKLQRRLQGLADELVSTIQANLSTQTPDQTKGRRRFLLF